MYRKLPPKDRANIMRQYKKTNPKSSYSEMVSHVSEELKKPISDKKEWDGHSVTLDILLNDIKNNLNPNTWGVKNYSYTQKPFLIPDNYHGAFTFGEAFNKAKKKGIDKFLWTNPDTGIETLYNTNQKPTTKEELLNVQRAETKRKSPLFWDEMAKFIKVTRPEEHEKVINDMLDLHKRYGDPYVDYKKFTKEDNVRGINRAYFSPDRNNITLPIGETGLPDLGDYTAELLHARQLADAKTLDNYTERQFADFKKAGINPEQKDFDTKYDATQYDLPGSIENVHRTEQAQLQHRIARRNYKDEESPEGKEYREFILNRHLGPGNPNDYGNAHDMQYDINKPYTFQHDIRLMQKALAEKGYDMSKSVKKDGTYDGLWGSQSKSAFLDYSNKKNKSTKPK